MRNLIKKILSEGYWEELYKSKRYTQKFDIGDRVVMNGTVGGKSLNNELGTVLKYKHTGGGAGHPHRVYLIKFDNWSDDVNFLKSPVQADQNRAFIDSRCSDGSCWYSTSDNLEPAPSTDTVFDQLHESEYDLDWVKEIINDDTFTLEALIRNNTLQINDEVEIYGDVYSLSDAFDDPDGENTKLLFTLKGEKFAVSGTKASFSIIKFTWLTPMDERPNNWRQASTGNAIIVDKDTWEFDKNLKIKIIKSKQLVEQEEKSEDEFGWVKDLGLPIEIGDVFYIVDDYNKKQPEDFRPKHVRYVVLITNYHEHKDKIHLVKKLCNPNDFTYNKADYQINSKKCTGYNENNMPTIEYKKATELVGTKYWRRVN